MKITNQIEIIEQELQEAHQVLSNFMADPKLIETIAEMAHLMTQAIENGGKIITCGNGGSHCDAMHFAEELTGRYRNDRKSLPAIAISDAAHLTCVGNDYGYEDIFIRQLKVYAEEGDVLVGISASGNSANLLSAFKYASTAKIKTAAGRWRPLGANGPWSYGRMHVYSSTT